MVNFCTDVRHRTHESLQDYHYDFEVVSCQKMKDTVPHQCNRNGKKAAYYTVTMRGVRVTICIVEIQWALHILSVCLQICLIFPSRALHPLCAVLYCSPWPVCLCHIFTLSHKCHDFWEKVLNIKYVFWYSLQRLSETFLILRRSEWDKGV
jgi:hypothetical protein